MEFNSWFEIIATQRTETIMDLKLIKPIDKSTFDQDTATSNNEHLARHYGTLYGDNVAMIYSSEFYTQSDIIN